MEDNFVVLADENGKETKFEFIDVVQYMEKEYVILLPENNEKSQFLICEINKSEAGETSYIPVEDMEVLESVYNIFKENNIIVLTDENGKDASFELLDVIQYNEKEYVVMLPEKDEDGQVFIFEVQETGEEEMSYTPVENLEILESVYNIFKEKFKDEFNFED